MGGEGRGESSRISFGASSDASNNIIDQGGGFVNTESGAQAAQGGRITVDELMEGIGDKPKTTPAQHRQGADSGINVSDLLDETVAKRSGAPADPVAAAVEGFRSTGTVTNKQAQDILNSARAVTQLMKEADLKIYGLSASQQRTAVKEAVAKLANAEVDTTAGTDYDNSDTAVAEDPIYASHQSGQDIVNFDHEQWENNKQKAKATYQLTEEDHNAVDDYVGGAAYNLNATMRGDTSYERTAFVDYWIQQTISGLSKFPQFTGRTYRNLTFKTQGELDAFVSQYSIGENVETVQFTSASKDPNGYTVPGNYIVYMVIDGFTGKDISDSYSIPGQQEVIYLPETTLKVTAIKTANDGFPLIYAQEVKVNGKNVESDSGRDRQSASGTNHEGQRGDAEGKRHDLDGIFNIEGVRGGSTSENGVQVQQPGRLSQEVTPAADESVGAAPSGFDPISHLQYEYGTIPEGEKAVRDDSLPVSTDGTDRASVDDFVSVEDHEQRTVDSPAYRLNGYTQHQKEN